MPAFDALEALAKGGMPILGTMDGGQEPEELVEGRTSVAGPEELVAGTGSTDGSSSLTSPVRATVPLIGVWTQEVGRGCSFEPPPPRRSFVRPSMSDSDTHSGCGDVRLRDEGVAGPQDRLVDDDREVGVWPGASIDFDPVATRAFDGVEQLGVQQRRASSGQGGLGAVRQGLGFGRGPELTLIDSVTYGEGRLAARPERAWSSA